MSEKLKEQKELSPIQFIIINEFKKIIPESWYRIEWNNLYINEPDNLKILEKSLENILNDLEIEYTIDVISFLNNKNIVITLENKEYIKIISDYSLIKVLRNKIEKILW